jgi:hypothetical protein
MNLTTSQFRRIVKNANLALESPSLSDLNLRQRLVLQRETAYTCVKAIQSGESDAVVRAMAQAAGITLGDSSYSNRSTWNDTRYTEYALRGCGLKQMPMGWKANRVGRARVVHNLKSTDSRGMLGTIVKSRKGGRKIVPKQSANGMRAGHRADANFASRTSDGLGLPLVIRGSAPVNVETRRITEARVSGTMQDVIRQNPRYVPQS